MKETSDIYYILHDIQVNNWHVSLNCAWAVQPIYYMKISLTFPSFFFFLLYDLKFVKYVIKPIKKLFIETTICKGHTANTPQVFSNCTSFPQRNCKSLKCCHIPERKKDSDIPCVSWRSLVLKFYCLLFFSIFPALQVYFHVLSGEIRSNCTVVQFAFNVSIQITEFALKYQRFCTHFTFSLKQSYQQSVACSDKLTLLKYISLVKKNQ